jgi:hypothetical protein
VRSAAAETTLIMLTLAALAAAPRLAQAQAPSADAEAGSTAATVSLDAPGMLGLLSFNPAPTAIDAGPFGTWCVDGALSGLGFTQSARTAADHAAGVDVGNAQVIVQKPAGAAQFYVQAGAYAIPALGTPYNKATSAATELSSTYGLLPQAFVKLAPLDDLSILAGKLPSLIGAEDTFTFQNFNIQRGLLWNQEPAISRGVQANLTAGQVTLSVSANDGFYSDRLSWLSGSATWAIDADRSLTAAGGGNLARSHVSSPATPLAQNDGSLCDLVYTQVAKPFTVVPYMHYARVDRDPAAGLLSSASSYGAALLASATIGDRWGLSARLEGIATTGRAHDAAATNLLYGAGSRAVSATLTPTYVFRRLFVRADVSAVAIFRMTQGDGFGSTGEAGTQLRALIEAGVVY